MQNTQVAYLETIEGLLEQNRIEEAIDALLKFVSSRIDLRQDIVQQSGDFQDTQRDKDRGVISREDYKLGANRVRYALLRLIKELSERAENETIGMMPSETNVTIVPAREVATLVAKSPPVRPLSAVPKFVIVYDLADTPKSDLLNKHLNVLKFTRKIRVYNVQEAIGGDLLAAAETELADADYLLVLVTVNIFNSPQWFELVSKALEQGRRVIPILVEKADYDGTGLEKLRSLPSLGRAVSDFPNLDAAYADIVTELRKLLPK